MKDTNDNMPFERKLYVINRINIKAILDDIAESWGYDDFAAYFATGLSQNDVRILASDVAEIIRSYSENK